MEIIKQIKTDKIDLLAVSIPKESKNVDVLIYMNKVSDFIRWWDADFHAHLIELPDGDYRLLGFATDLKQEDLELILPSVIVGHKQCFKELLFANGVYLENPYGEKPERMIPFMRRGNYTTKQLDRLDDYNRDLKRWKDAEEKLGPWLIVLKNK